MTLAFHNAVTRAILSAETGTIHARNITVKADSVTFTEAGVLSLAAGAVGVALVVLYQDVQSVTDAFIYLDGGSLTATGDLTLNALGCNQIITISAAAAGGAVGATASAAASKLRGTIRALVSGSGTFNVGGTANITARDSGDSILTVNSAGIAAGIGGVNLSAAVALQNTTVEAGVKAASDR